MSMSSILNTEKGKAFKNQRQSISHVFSAKGYEIEGNYREPNYKFRCDSDAFAPRSSFSGS